MFTPSQIAQEAHEPLHKILFIIRSRGIQPVRRAGNVRLFDEAAKQFVIGELARIVRDRTAGKYEYIAA